MVEEIIISVGSALVYSFSFYVKKFSSTEGEPFKPYKLLSTLIVGLVIGVGLFLSGDQIGRLTFMEIIAANIGAIAVVESILKALYRQAKGENGVGVQ